MTTLKSSFGSGVSAQVVPWKVRNKRVQMTILVPSTMKLDEVRRAEKQLTHCTNLNLPVIAIIRKHSNKLVITMSKHTYKSQIEPNTSKGGYQVTEKGIRIKLDVTPRLQQSSSIHTDASQIESDDSSASQMETNVLQNRKY